MADFSADTDIEVAIYTDSCLPPICCVKRAESDASPPSTYSQLAGDKIARYLSEEHQLRSSGSNRLESEIELPDPNADFLTVNSCVDSHKQLAHMANANSNFFVSKVGVVNGNYNASEKFIANTYNTRN